MKNKKSLGQHWLTNREILDEIADLAAEEEDSSASKTSAKTEVKVCLEIGPGLGTLTSSLLRRFEKVVAIEYDEALAKNLPKSFPGKNLEIINADILDFDFSQIIEKYVIAGNIPYYITSPILKRVLTTSNLPEKIVLLVQKEVAERILDEHETQLSLFVKNRAEVKAGPVVKKQEFTPAPKVDSQVIVLKPKTPEIEEEVFKLIKVGFRAPRKKLIHNLKSLKSEKALKEILQASGVDADARPGDLDLKKWANLWIKLKEK